MCLLPHLLSKALTGRSGWPRRFLGGASWVVGARPKLSGAPIRPHSLLISNHVSWLDILVLGATTGCAFVSKDSLGHGLIHWLADQNHTLYIRRDHRKGAKDQALAIAARLDREQPVALFPEGTTGPGDRLLPFRSTLLEAAAHASSDVEIRPVALDYGAASPEIGWYGEPGRDNVLRILNRRGTLPVTVRVLPPISAADRKSLTQAARAAIEAALPASSSPPAGL